MMNRNWKFLPRADWAAFYLTTLVAAIIYWFTLTPEVDLRFAGVFSAGAMYPGIPFPPGFPIWTAYAWVFTKVPFATVAARVAFETSLAAALTCGVVALTVARAGWLTASRSQCGTLSRREREVLRMTCGFVAGMGFGLDGCFWQRAVTADPWPLSLLLFALAMFWLTQWCIPPYKNQCLFIAVLLYGLSVCNNQILLAAAPGILFFATVMNPKIGRDFAFVAAISLWTIITGNAAWDWFFGYLNPRTLPVIASIAFVMSIACLTLSIRTRAFFTEWRPTLACGALVLVGLSPYFLVPIFSMTDPPMNWAYPRTPEGFFHLVTRGQFEQPQFTRNIGEFLWQLGIAGRISLKQYGVPYLVGAFIPLFFLRQMRGSGRKWIVGMTGLGSVLCGLIVIGLNPQPDRSTIEFMAPVFAAAHLPIAMLSGCGLVLIGAVAARSKPLGGERSRSLKLI